MKSKNSKDGSARRREIATEIRWLPPEDAHEAIRVRQGLLDLLTRGIKLSKH